MRRLPCDRSAEVLPEIQRPRAKLTARPSTWRFRPRRTAQGSGASPRPGGSRSSRGSGKTCVLRAVTRLLYPLAGRIEIGVEPSEIGFLFQDDALLPWRTVRQNVALGLRFRGTAPRAAAAKVDEWLLLVGLQGFGDRYPRQLSGGQRKRVAIAQVLVLEPKLLLMDEPFASLDAIVRTRLTQELLEWVERERGRGMRRLLARRSVRRGVALLVLVWIDLGSKVALSLILVAVLIFFAVYTGIKEVDQRLVERVRTLGGDRRELIREVYVPSLTAWVIGNLKVAVGFAFTGAVVGEFRGLDPGSPGIQPPGAGFRRGRGLLQLVPFSGGHVIFPRLPEPSRRLLTPPPGGIQTLRSRSILMFSGSNARQTAAFALCSMLVLLATPRHLFGQEPVTEADRIVAEDAGTAPSMVDGVEIDGPPPPVAPAMISRDASGNATIRAVRVTTPLDVDGELEEAFYRETPAISDFVQTVPTERGEPSELTEAWIGFDESYVYVAARVWEPEGPDGWVSNEMRRDSNQLRQNDNFGVFLDTFYDRRNALAFYVTPIGGFADFQITNEGNPNFDWNPVAQIRTARFDGGWSLEMAIPFKSLRYRPGRDQVWGIQIRRSVLKRNEWNHLTHVPFSAAGDGSMAVFRVSMYGTLVGIEAPPLGSNIELKPYVSSGVQTDMTTAVPTRNDGSFDAGFDAKWALTQNLTADVTVNTDFAQVEVDEQQVNLTRFSLTFPEKREFFLEGRGIYNFGSGGISGGGGGGGGFGGGAAPTLFYSRRIGLEGGEPVQVLGGGRLTGKVGSFEVGALTMQTDDAPAIGAESTNFSVVRLRRDLFSRSTVGVLLQNRSNSVVAESGSNRAWGVDGSFGITDEMSLLTYYAQSHTPGLVGNDRSYRGRFSYDSDRYGASVEHLVVGNDFNPEIGLVRRRDFQQSALSARVSRRPASIDWIRQLTLDGSFDYLESDRFGFLESRGRGGSFQIALENGDGFTASANDNREYLDANENISGFLIPAGQYDFQDYQLSYRFGSQRPYQGNVRVLWGGYFSGERLSFGLNQGRAELTPQLSLEPSLEFNWIDLPQSGEMVRYDAHVVRTRATYTFTPRAYVSGLVQYSTGSDSFSGNFRLRWEWAPGSELFIVYTEDRNTDVLERWSDLSNRGLVLKLTRLFQL
ncbi:MAG: ATP-binding cassette domain-containing protein [Gemmatimonadota bacterium]